MNTEKSRSTLNVLFYIKKQKLLKTGEAPICMRVTINKRKQEIMVKRSIPVELWDQKKESSKGKDRAAKELNHYLDTTKAKILAIHHDLLEEGLEVTAESVRDRFYGRDTSKHTLLTIYAEQNRKWVKCVAADSIYANNANRRFCTKYGISTSFVCKGRAAKDEALMKVLRSELSRHPKQDYSLSRIKARNRKTEILWIFFRMHTANLMIDRIKNRTAKAV